MKLRLFQVDAFTSRVFGGNPAGVMPLERWLPDATLQSIAAEMNLAETAFFVPLPPGLGERDGAGAQVGAQVGAGGDADFHLRWFTPTMEMDLCGHATLASAHVLVRHLGWGRPLVRFASRSGVLGVERESARDDARLVLDFPARPGTPVTDAAFIDALARALGKRPREVLQSRDTLAVFEHASDVRALRPDVGAIEALDTFGVIASAPADTAPETADADAPDFVSRFFAPRAGVPEDPVTGSAHCTLVPYWAARLGRATLRARQVSSRVGELFCEYRPASGGWAGSGGARADSPHGRVDLPPGRVRLGGHAVTFFEGMATVPGA